ncbi:MAG: sulfotransferase family protein [Proteobacteria bacterium]|nr:MAG: sulfotransferase family protein [Pseudomonadota bacterium]
MGAGLGRTGTNSLKVALERLLGAPCYHMIEVFAHPEHVAPWHAAARGDMPDWEKLFAGYAAAVDWPAASFWPEIAAAFPDAVILLSERDPASWWKSASSTIFPSMGQVSGAWREMIDTLFAARFTTAITDRDACIAAYQRHYEDALRRIPASRLVRWRASDGWEPLCRALGVPVPNEPFPHTNTSEEFHQRIALHVPGRDA